MDPVGTGRTVSPMTDWLKGHIDRSYRARSAGALGISVCLLTEDMWAYAGTAQTVEEAMANALNALMAQQGEENAKETNRS